MGNRTLYIYPSADAVDAALVNKDAALRSVAAELGVPLARVGAVGDSENDLPFLTVEGLGLVGAPANAQERVRREVASMPHGVLLEGRTLEGFLQFRALAMERGITHLFSDRDGVLLARTEHDATDALAGIFREAGLDGEPDVFVLTGSSRDMNRDFMRAAGLGPELASNPSVRRFPWRVLAENGAVQVNVLTGEERDLPDVLDADMLLRLKSDFEPRLLDAMEERLFPRFGFTWSRDPRDQRAKVFVPEKETMVTVTVPLLTRDGRDYRASPESDAWRAAVLDLMALIASELGMACRRI